MLLKIDEVLVKNLLLDQFPTWAHLKIKQVESSGTDNAIFRLGSDMCVRLPKVDWASGDAKNEQAILASLKKLPLFTPRVFALGLPNKSYPWNWSICDWLDGENAYEAALDLDDAALKMADFLCGLRMSPNVALSKRGGPLSDEDEEVKKALISLEGKIDTTSAQKIWQQCLKIPLWSGQKTLVHGDLLPANLLVKNNKLYGVIDWGLSGLGDPSCDLIVAYSLFNLYTRNIFRKALAVDDETWVRGLGRALAISLIILPFYWHTNPYLVDVALRMMKEIFIEAAELGLLP